MIRQITISLEKPCNQSIAENSRKFETLFFSAIFLITFCENSILQSSSISLQ